MAKFCPECANPIVESNTSPVCPKCGARLPITSSEPQPTDKQKEAQKPEPNKNRLYDLLGIKEDSETKQLDMRLFGIDKIDDALKSNGNTTTKKRSTLEWIAIVCGGIILLVFLSAFIAGMLSGISGASTAPSPSPNNPINTPTPTPTMSIEQIKNNALKITYDDLLRYNENYIGKTVYFRGKISQVFPPSGDNYDLILDTSGEYSFVEGRIYISNYKGSRFLEGDTIDVWGKVDGLIPLKSVLGKESSIPELTARQIELIKKVS